MSHGGRAKADSSLTTRKLKKALGAPFAQDDTNEAGIRNREQEQGSGIGERDVKDNCGFLHSLRFAFAQVGSVGMTNHLVVHRVI